MVQIFLEELIGVATSEKDGLMPSIQRMTTSYQKDQQKYCKIAEFGNSTTGISMLISVFKNHENSSPSVVLLTGYSDDLSVNSIKRGTYLTNVYYQKKENKTIVYVKSSAYVYISTLCIGTNGGLNLSHENNLDLPSGAIEIPISWQEFSNIWELEGLIPIANLESKGLLRKGVLSPILVCNKDSVQEVCIVRLASSSSAYIGMILYVYWGGYTSLFFINSKAGNSYIIRKVNGSIISEIEFKRKNDHLFVRSKTNTASFRVSALFLDTTGVDLSLSMNIVDENLDDAEDIEIL